MPINKNDTQFTDCHGRTWNVSVNAVSIKRVRDKLTIDLANVSNPKLFYDLIDDPIKLVDLVYLLCKPDADAQTITDEDFGRAMAGNAIDEATTALLQAIVNFHGAVRGAPLKAAMDKALEARKEGYDRAAANIASIDVAQLLATAEAEAKQP